ncbi:glycosyltransferase [Flavobacterium sp. H122]|uniref:glycosyltransferase n=1 Tax=Flavobacterium sp. H122 TaxID=2529860 RepID=UPI0010A9A1CB|nr:glycosyltransferase [Flavobacterium sp. H122]
MKFLIVTNAPIIQKHNENFAYSPYVNEMIIWAKHIEKIAFCCPRWKNEKGLLISKIPFQVNNFFWLSDFDIKSFKSIIKAIVGIPVNFLIIFRAMLWADHIHLRCPGNIGLLACFVQILFPFKKKTAKYAGNWDPKAKQPWTYRLQKWILSNTFLTRNMQVLVYGEWPCQTKNIKPFFTASYSIKDLKETVQERKLDSKINFLFVGTLSPGKRPIYAIKLIQKLKNEGFDIHLSVLGDGKEKGKIVRYIEENNLKESITLHGNKTSEEVKIWYLKSDFLILPSKSEGWPKVVAEAMFWGCVPLATSISCVPYMLDYGKRGGLLRLELDNDVKMILELMKNHEKYDEMSKNALGWSRKYTTEYFESEIVNLVR